MKRINSQARYQLRQEFCAKYEGRCAYCRRYIGMKGTVDHYLPQALGGTNARSNLRWCCNECNGLKGCMAPAEWERRRPAPAADCQTKGQRRVQLLAAIAPCARREHGKNITGDDG